jgi:ubiquinol-cytochrome c reductase iron-sulfur subunit
LTRSQLADAWERLMTDDVDRNRRHFLTVATAVAGGGGIALAAIPFLSSLQPSARALALGAPVEVPLDTLEPGEMVRVIWRGKLVFVLRRDPEMLNRLSSATDFLRDPDSAESEQPEYAANEYRSIRPEYLVVEGSCTHLGCAPLAEFDVRARDNWFGGFFCPCHGSRFDLAGRVYSGVPAPTNLRVPPYRFTRDDLIMIGSDSGAA